MKTFNSIPSSICTVVLVLITSLQSLAAHHPHLDADSIQSKQLPDKMAAVRISTPTIPMYRKADREIAVNMNNDIRAVKSLHISINFSSVSDDAINNQFNQRADVHLGSTAAQADEFLTQQFNAEHHVFGAKNLLFSADCAMHTSFIKSINRK